MCLRMEEEVIDIKEETWGWMDGGCYVINLQVNHSIEQDLPLVFLI